MSPRRSEDALKTSFLLFSNEETSTKQITTQTNKIDTNMETNLIRYKLVHKNEQIVLKWKYTSKPIHKIIF